MHTHTHTHTHTNLNLLGPHTVTNKMKMDESLHFVSALSNRAAIRPETAGIWVNPEVAAAAVAVSCAASAC